MKSSPRKDRSQRGHVNWPGMSNKRLASVLERAADRTAEGKPPTDYQHAAMWESVERLRELPEYAD